MTTAQYLGQYRIEDLCNDLKLCNNGYLFAPTPGQLALAKANPDVFTVYGGTIYSKPRFAQQFQDRQVVMPAPKAQPASVWSDGPDYEAWILSRQEALTCND